MRPWLAIGNKNIDVSISCCWITNYLLNEELLSKGNNKLKQQQQKKKKKKL